MNGADYALWTLVIWWWTSAGGGQAARSSHGQRVFEDSRPIGEVDPGKHGFHLMLDDEFVRTHLQPVHAPIIYASAIALTGPDWQQHQQQQQLLEDRNGSRQTKILYPENGNAEDGLLGGKTIKLMGLRERTWYYLCVEYESNLNRHELVSGMSCLLRRTLDKFGNSAVSMVGEPTLLDAQQHSLTVSLTVQADTPLRLDLSLTVGPDDPETSAGDNDDVTAGQTYVVRRSQTLQVHFDRLRPETVYGRLCVVQQPLTVVYSAMGRAVNGHLQECFAKDFKTAAFPAADDPASVVADPLLRVAAQTRLNGGAVKTETTRWWTLFVGLSVTIFLLLMAD